MPKKQDPEEPIEKPIARKAKVRRPRHQKAKKQVTVRVDQDLLKKALRRAKREGLRLTDVVEQGLVVWTEGPRKSPTSVRLRFLCNHLPQHLEEQTLAFLAFYAYPRMNLVEEEYRKSLDRILLGFRQSLDYQSCLKRLGTLDENCNDLVAAG
jgi:hypothetical protein